MDETLLAFREASPLMKFITNAMDLSF